nr:MAG TPA: hypothetical protein [Caudoviricetes sp.]
MFLIATNSHKNLIVKVISKGMAFLYAFRKEGDGMNDKVRDSR